MTVELLRNRRWVPDVQSSGFFKPVSGAFSRTPDGHVWNSGSGTTSEWEKRPDLEGSLHLASRHPLIAGLHH